MSKSASYLLVKHSHSILAHIFLLPVESDVKAALKFIMKVLNEASNSAIDIQSIVKSCVVPLLAELVVALGHENQENSQQVWVYTYPYQKFGIHRSL